MSTAEELLEGVRRLRTSRDEQAREVERLRPFEAQAQRWRRLAFFWAAMAGGLGAGLLVALFG